MTVQPSLFSRVPAIQVTRAVPPVERKRLVRQARLLLERLRRGPITNREIVTELGILNGTGRVSDLRAAGYTVTVIERDYQTGRCLYALVSEP